MTVLRWGPRDSVEMGAACVEVGAACVEVGAARVEAGEGICKVWMAAAASEGVGNEGIEWCGGGDIGWEVER